MKPQTIERFMDITSDLVEKYTKNEDGPLPRRDGFYLVGEAFSNYVF